MSRRDIDSFDVSGISLLTTFRIDADRKFHQSNKIPVITTGQKYRRWLSRSTLDKPAIS